MTTNILHKKKRKERNGKSRKKNILKIIRLK